MAVSSPSDQAPTSSSAASADTPTLSMSGSGHTRAPGRDGCLSGAPLRQAIRTAAAAAVAWYRITDARVCLNGFLIYCVTTRSKNRYFASAQGMYAIVRKWQSRDDSVHEVASEIPSLRPATLQSKSVGIYQMQQVTVKVYLSCHIYKERKIVVRWPLVNITRPADSCAIHHSRR